LCLAGTLILKLLFFSRVFLGLIFPYSIVDKISEKWGGCVASKFACGVSSRKNYSCRGSTPAHPSPHKGKDGMCFKLNLCLGMKVDGGKLSEDADARQDGKEKESVVQSD